LSRRAALVATAAIKKVADFWMGDAHPKTVTARRSSAGVLGARVSLLN